MQLLTNKELVCKTWLINGLLLGSSLFLFNACDDSSSAGAAPEENAFLSTEFPVLETPISAPPSGLDVADTYSFSNKFPVPGLSSVSYSGQSARLMMIDDLVTTVKNYSENATATVAEDLALFLEGTNTEFGSVDGVDYLFTADAAMLIPGTTFGDISTGKSLRSKMAGNDKAEHLIGGALLGWSEGLDSDPTPEELTDYLIGLLESEVTDGSAPMISTVDGDIALDVVYADGQGRDFFQLLEKFLTGAVTFSQGTADYLKADFSGRNVQDGSDPFTESEHQWDEAFGYFGAARDYLLYTDEEIAGKGGRPGFADGYYDTDADTFIDLGSEINLGHSSNCAKRDLGSAGNNAPTDFTTDVLNAFLTGRKILSDAANASFPADHSELNNAALQAATVWEKCIAATAVHYINETIADLNAIVDGQFASLEAYKALATHWSEMKGFALSLQFNPESPFHADADTLAAYVYVMGLMGDAPVLADGTQARVAFEGGLAQYRSDLETARQIFQNAYGFDAENVENW